MGTQLLEAKNQAYIEKEPYWKMMDDATSSQRHVHEETTEYLPRLTGMTDEQYTAYIQRAGFPLYTKHTLSTFVGMVMRKQAKLNDIPEEFVKNMDGSGTSLQKYINTLSYEFLKKGRAASLVDYGTRAKILMYDADSILDWQTKTINDVEQLTYVKLRELASQDTNPFDSTVEEDDEYQYRILTLEDSDSNGENYVYRQRLYKADMTLLHDIYPESNFKQLDFIPVVIHGGVEPDYPPLITIAEENFNFYRLDADYKHGLHYVALPTPYVTAVDPDDSHAPKAIGPSEIWYLPEGASAGMLEFKGSGLGAIADAKKEVYENIVILSSRILAPPSSQNETATAANIRNAGETASLAEMVSDLSEELTWILNVAVNWTQVVDDLEVVINSDFLPNVLSGSDVASYVASYLKGGISFHTLFEVLKRGEIQQGNRDIDVEIKAIEEEMIQRNAMQVTLAEEMEKIKPTEPGITQQPEGEQVNEGQNFKEN